MRREIAADIMPQSGIVHADAQLDMHSGERFASALAAKHKRSRLRESHDPVKGHCDRRTFDRGAGLPCREDHILRQLRIVSDPDDRHMQCRQARPAGKGEGSTIVIGDCGRLLLGGIRRTERKEKPVSAGVAFVPLSAIIFVVSEVEGHLVHGISGRRDPPRRFQNAPKDTPKEGDSKNKREHTCLIGSASHSSEPSPQEG